ncbi:hypothetical protein P9112_003620 [Eukaryota sp. TZLM1-RC]
MFYFQFTSLKRKSTNFDASKRKTTSRGRASTVAPKTKKHRVTSEPSEAGQPVSINQSFSHKDLHVDETTEQIVDLKSLEIFHSANVNLWCIDIEANPKIQYKGKAEYLRFLVTFEYRKDNAKKD